MRDELIRQLVRRRTQVVLALVAAVPLLLTLIYVVRGAPELTPGASPQLMHLASDSALAFALYVTYLAAPLLLVAIAALFAGDAIASEASWGTLRYLLTAPLTRRQLLVRKALAAATLVAITVVLLVGMSLACGLVAFGWHDLETPVGGTIPAAAGAGRLALATLYVFVTLVPFAAIALLLSTLLDAPLAAVAGSVGVALLSQILDVVPTLGDARNFLPTHYAYAWLDLFVDPPDPTMLASGTLQSTCYVVAFLAAAWWWFDRRDITS
ncbi:MAG: transporter permease [Thermoleophilia bacterium]|nr:transporter permease [Thermoleophilia bacterium]